MGRPKKTNGELMEWDVRVTPDGGRPISFEPLEEDFTKFLACLEGGEGTEKQLHYHIYCQTNRSESYIRKYFATLAGGTGNKSYSMRKSHEGTIGYVIKEGHVVSRLGFDTRLIDEYFEKSKAYRKDLEASRKKKQRDLHRTLSDIVSDVAPPFPSPEGHTGAREYASNLVNLVLNKYSELDLKFPSRTALDGAVCKHIYKNELYRWYVQELYARSFSQF